MISRKLTVRNSVRITALSLVAILASNMVQAGEDAKSRYQRPLDIPFPESAPYSPQLATLGKMLFFDPRLSKAKNMNCATCHNPSFGYEVPVPQPLSYKNRPTLRQAPTTQNLAWVSPLMWDGWAETLEEQAPAPVIYKMGGKFKAIVRELNRIPEYQKWFGKLFPEKGISQETIAVAIATFERTIVSGWTPFDRWVDGDDTALSDAAKRGFALFNGDAGCANCHSGWNFTDNKVHDIGLDTDDIGAGRYHPDKPLAQYAVKTPSLRDQVYRAPYMRDGSIASLRGVIRFYVSGGVERPSRSPDLHPISLSKQQQQDLLAFLESLTSDNTDVSMPILPN